MEYYSNNIPFLRNREGTIMAVREKMADREERLLVSAREMISRDGLSTLRMPDLARESGVPVGTLYRHFANRDDVVAALADAALSVRLRKLMAVCALFERPDERLLAVLLLDFLFNVWHPEAFHTEVACMMWEEASALRKRLHEDNSSRVSSLVQQKVADFLSFEASPVDTREQDVRALSTGVWAMISGLSLIWLSDRVNSSRPVGEAVAFCRPQLLGFLRGHAPDSAALAIPFFDTVANTILDRQTEWKWKD